MKKIICRIFVICLIIVGLQGTAFAKSGAKVNEYCKQAIELIENKKYDEAVDLLNKSIANNPNSNIAYANRAQAAKYLGKYAEAKADAEKAIELNPKNSLAYEVLGTTYLIEKKYSEAVNNFDKAILYDKKNKIALVNRGTAKSKQGDSAGAIADYTQAIKIDPNFTTAYYNRGLEKYDLKDYHGAIADYTQTIKIDPNSAKAYYNRGNAKSSLNNYQEAIEDYTQAIKIDPNHTKAYNNRGSAKFEIKDYKGAIEDYTQAIKIDPNYAVAYYSRGNAKSSLNNYPEAVEDYTQTIKINPDYTEAYYSRGNAKFKINDYKGAIEDLTKAIEKNNNNPPYFFMRGLAYYMKSKQNPSELEKAYIDFDNVLKLEPNNLEARINKFSIAYNLYNNYSKSTLLTDDFDTDFENSFNYINSVIMTKPLQIRSYLVDCCSVIISPKEAMPGAIATDYEYMQDDVQSAVLRILSAVAANRYTDDAENKNIKTSLDYLIQAMSKERSANYSLKLFYEKLVNNEIHDDELIRGQAELLKILDTSCGISLDNSTKDVKTAIKTIYGLFYHALGNAYYNNEQNGNAMEYYKKANYYYDYKNPDVYYDIYYAQEQAGNYGEALDAINKYISFIKQPSSSNNSDLIYIKRAKLKEKLSDKDGALTDLTKAIQIYPRSGQACFERSLVYNDKQKYDLAIADLKKIVTWSDGKTYNDRRLPLSMALISLDVVYYNLGVCYSNMGDYSAALTYLNKGKDLALYFENKEQYQACIDLINKINKYRAY